MSSEKLFLEKTLSEDLFSLENTHFCQNKNQVKDRCSEDRFFFPKNTTFRTNMCKMSEDFYLFF